MGTWRRVVQTCCPFKCLKVARPAKNKIMIELCSTKWHCSHFRVNCALTCEARNGGGFSFCSVVSRHCWHTHVMLCPRSQASDSMTCCICSSSFIADSVSPCDTEPRAPSCWPLPGQRHWVHRLLIDRKILNSFGLFENEGKRRFKIKDMVVAWLCIIKLLLCDTKENRKLVEINDRSHKEGRCRSHPRMVTLILTALWQQS